MNGIVRTIVSLVFGCAIAVVMVQTGNAVARNLWADYAAAEPTKAYSFAMLVSRLAVGGFCTAAASWGTTIIARDDGRAAWLLGGIFLAVSLPIHLLRVWADYPPWYHFVYLGYLVPIAGLTGWAVHSVSRRRGRPFSYALDR